MSYISVAVFVFVPFPPLTPFENSYVRVNSVGKSCQHHHLDSRFLVGALKETICWLIDDLAFFIIIIIIIVLFYFTLVKSYNKII